MAENNIIVISYPQGAAGHMAGRFLASCKNVVWYDSEKNGLNPWDCYADVDKKFTPFHFNRKFFGAAYKGIDNLTVAPALDMAEKNKSRMSPEEQKSNIESWKTKLFPNNLLYITHADMQDIHTFFAPAKHLVIIPTDVEKLVDRYMNTSLNYWVHRKNKDYTFQNLWEERAAKVGKTAKDLISEKLSRQVEEYKRDVLDTDVVIDSVEQFLDFEFFADTCNKLSLEVNEIDYNKVKSFVLENWV
jgi:hypothetical protein